MTPYDAIMTLQGKVLSSQFLKSCRHLFKFHGVFSGCHDECTRYDGMIHIDLYLLIDGMTNEPLQPGSANNSVSLDYFFCIDDG